MGSDFGGPLLPPDAPGVDWRSLTTALGRLDLNRRLTPYPLGAPQTPATYNQRFDVPGAAEQFLQAQQDRQRLADDIYTRLLRVTGVPRSGRVPNQPTAEELQVRRWLAQLAVNIVDYIDEDDVSTPFNFYTPQDADLLPFDVGECASSGNPATPDLELPKYWVFGTELPHVVVNEALAEYTDQAAPPGRTPPTTVKVWVELYNPFVVPQGSRLQPQDGFPVPLRVEAVPRSLVNQPAAYGPYRLVVANGLAARPLNDNVLGKPDAVRAATTDDDYTTPVGLVGGGRQAAPSPAVGPEGFFLAGPRGADARNTIAAPAVPPNTPWLQSPNLEYQRTFDPRQPEEKARGLTVLLRRLANPHVPFDPRPGVRGPDGEVTANPWYNPYVTVDYLDSVPLQDAAGRAAYASRGKRQPYAAHVSQIADQQPPAPRTAHTFGRPNNPGPLGGASDWLVHLDRELVSPMELLHVSGCQPHQLTQRFIVGAGPGQKFQHYAPWFDQTRRLYRLFEFVQTASRAGGADSAGRIPGKINLNTVWDPETFLALCDPQPSNGPNFTPDEVGRIWRRLIEQRTPGLGKGGGPGPDDRPFLGLATGYGLPDGPSNPDPQRPRRGSGINDTLLRADDPGADTLPGGGAAGPRLFQVQGEDHPYRQAELLTKVFNNVTTRSNVFAVWLTVGFFEVADDTVRPVKLGAEVGRAEGRHLRHRLFAIVDRSALPPDHRPARFDPRQDRAVLCFSVVQ
jgi:hypothetical protein